MEHAAPGAVFTVMLAAFPRPTGDVTEATATVRGPGATEDFCRSAEGRCGAVVHESSALVVKTVKMTRRSDGVLLGRLI